MPIKTSISVNTMTKIINISVVSGILGGLFGYKFNQFVLYIDHIEMIKNKIKLIPITKILNLFKGKIVIRSTKHSKLI